MKAIVFGLILFASLALPSAAQEERKQDDVVQLRSGGILVGRVLKLADDSIEILVNGEKESRRVDPREVMPYALYRIKLDRADRKSAAVRFALGEFCLAQGLYATAVREFEEAAALDKTLEEKCAKMKGEAHNEDARVKFEEAKKLVAERKYEEGNRLLHALVERYADTPYFEEARKEISKIAEAVKRENEEKKAQIEEKARAASEMKARVKEDQEKLAFDKTAALVDEAQKLWSEGLDFDSKNLTKADKAWKGAENCLLGAKRNIEVLSKSADPEIAKKARDLDKQADLWLAKTYYRLGRMWAVEMNVPSATEWLNKGIKVPHDESMDRLLNEILLALSQAQIRKRSIVGY